MKPTDYCLCVLYLSVAVFVLASTFMVLRISP